MVLSTSEKIKIMMKRRKMTLKDLAENTNQSSSNLSNKLSRDNFAENEIREIASALDCEYETFFVMRDTGEKLQLHNGWGIVTGKRSLQFAKVPGTSLFAINQKEIKAAFLPPMIISRQYFLVVFYCYLFVFQLLVSEYHCQYILFLIFYCYNQ